MTPTRDSAALRRAPLQRCLRAVENRGQIGIPRLTPVLEAGHRDPEDVVDVLERRAAATRQHADSSTVDAHLNRGPRLDRRSAAEQPHEKQHDRDDEQDVDEGADGVSPHHAKQPRDQQDNRECIQHLCLRPTASARSRT